MERRALGKRLGFVIGLSAAMTAGAATAETTWSLASYTSGGPFFESVKKLAETVEFLTEGRLKIEVYPGGTLGAPFKVTETVQNGIAEIGHLWPGLDWGVDKTSVLLAGYPAGPSSEEMLAWVYKGGGLELWQEWRMERFDLVAFPCNNLTKEVFLHSKKPVRTQEDYRGLKIRTIGAWAPIAEKLGASAVALPPDEIFPALERGVVDAAEWASPSVNLSMGLHEVARYIILPGIHSTMAMQECVIRKDAWEALDPRDQELFEMATRLMTASTWIQLGDADARTYQEWIEAGNEIVDLDPAFIEKIREVSIEWQDELAAEDPWFEKILESQRAYQEMWSGAPRYH